VLQTSAQFTSHNTLIVYYGTDMFINDKNNKISKINKLNRNRCRQWTLYHAHYTMNMLSRSILIGSTLAAWSCMAYHILFPNGRVEIYGISWFVQTTICTCDSYSRRWNHDIRNLQFLIEWWAKFGHFVMSLLHDSLSFSQKRVFFTSTFCATW